MAAGRRSGGSGDPAQTENEICKCHIPHPKRSFCSSEQPLPCLMRTSAFHHTLFNLPTKHTLSPPAAPVSCFFFFFSLIATSGQHKLKKLMHILWKSTCVPVKTSALNECGLKMPRPCCFQTRTGQVGRGGPCCPLRGLSGPSRGCGGGAESRGDVPAGPGLRLLLWATEEGCTCTRTSTLHQLSVMVAGSHGDVAALLVLKVSTRISRVWKGRLLIF